MPCIIAGCTNQADHNLSIRLRRPDTSAIWAPNTEAFLCDLHAAQGMVVTITLQPTNTGNIETQVSSSGGNVVSRITPIVNVP